MNLIDGLVILLLLLGVVAGARAGFVGPVLGLLGAVVIGFAIPQTSRVKGHVLMDFLTRRMSRGIRKALYVLTRILAFAIFAIIGWNVWLLGEGYRQTGEVTLTIQLPLYPVAYGIALCCFIECLELIMDVLEMRQQEAER